MVLPEPAAKPRFVWSVVVANSTSELAFMTILVPVESFEKLPAPTAELRAVMA